MYNAEETKKQILECAVRLFARKGLQATSISDIVSGAGCSKGALFYHFPTKDALIQEMFQSCHNAIEDAAREGMDDLSSVTEKLCRRCYNITQFANLHPDIAAVNAMYLSSVAHTASSGYGYRASCRHFEGINALIEEGLASGELKEMPPLLLGEMFYSIASVPYMYIQNNPGAIDNTEYWEDIYEIIRSALARTPWQ